MLKGIFRRTQLLFLTIVISLILSDATIGIVHDQLISLQDRIAKIEYTIDNSAIIDGEHLNELNSLTGIKVGSLFSRYAVQRSIISLYSTQEFSRIDTYMLETPHGVILKFEMKSVMRIKKLLITGVGSDELYRSILKVIRLSPGDTYLTEIAQKDQDLIIQKCNDHGYFDVKVNINTDRLEGILTYQVVLGDLSYITQFTIQGNSAIFKEHIIEVCNKHVGNQYLKSKIRDDFAVISLLYRKRYYPSIRIVDDFDHRTGVLIYNIEEGKQLLLDFVDQNGKPILRDSVFRKLLDILDINREKSERELLRRRIERYINNPSRWVEIVQSHYEEKGYYGTEVQSRTLTKSPLHVELSIKPGHRYTVRSVDFIGNEAFTNDELLREMESKPIGYFSRRFGRQYFSELALERDRNRLKILYEKSGYRDVDITFKIVRQNSKKGRDGYVSVQLFFVEPYKEVIHRCHFTGNIVISNKSLYAALPIKPPQPNARLVLKDYENAILKLYYDKGYIDAEVVKSVYFDKMETASFQMEGNYTDVLSTGTIPKEIRDEFAKHSLTLSGMIIASSIDEEWSIQDVDDNARYTMIQGEKHLSVFEHGVLEFDISEGDQIIFGNFNFVGDIDVIPQVLHREVNRLTGTLFTAERLNVAKQNLFNTRLFEPGISTDRFRPISTENQTGNIEDNSTQESSQPKTVVNDVEFRLQKRKPGSYGASVGISSADGPRGTVSLSHYNLFKRNVRFQLRGRLGFQAYLYDTTLTEPWLIGRTSASLQLLARKLEEDDNVRALQGSFGLSRKLSESNRLNLDYSYRHLKDTSPDLGATDLSTTVSSIRLLWRQDTRFPSLNPVMGVLNEVTVEYAGGILGGRSSFIKSIFNTRYHHQLHERGYVLATSLRLGITSGLQANRGSELISFERFWAGGSTTVRGYEERGLGPEDITGKHRGNVQAIFNTELRFTIFDPFQGILFVDSGNVWDTISDIEYTWMPTSVGVGLRLLLGPLIGGVDYAVPLISVPGVPNRSLYFRVGSTF